MNIVTISQLIGPFTLSRLDLGPTIVTRFNNAVGEEFAIDLDFSGDTLYTHYTSIPASKRLEISNIPILDNNELLSLTNDISQLVNLDRAIKGKDDGIKDTALISLTSGLIIVGFLLVGAYLYIANTTSGLPKSPVTSTVVEILQWGYTKLLNGEVPDPTKEESP